MHSYPKGKVCAVKPFNTRRISAPTLHRNHLKVVIIVLVLLAVAFARNVIPVNALFLLVVLVPSVILHEVSHGYVANMFGDDTAKRAGRLTLNPIAHVDIFGSVFLPIILILSGLTPIGYAKPVPVNISNLRHPRNQSVLVSLAGPIVNIVLAILAGILLHLEIASAMRSNIAIAAQAEVTSSMLGKLLFYFGIINLLLAVFNLIPIPPLDGSAIIERFIPSSALGSYLQLRRVMLPVALVLFLVFPGVIQSAFTPFINLWTSIFIR